MFGLTVGVWIARYLGPEDYGLLSFTTSYVGIFSIITGLGLQNLVVKELVKSPERTGEIIGTSGLLLFVSGVFTYIISIVLIIFLRSDDSRSIILVSALASVLLLKFSEISMYALESKVISKYTVWINNLCLVIFSLAKIILINLNYEISYFILILCIESLALAVLLIYILNLKIIKLNNISVKVYYMFTLLKQSWPLLLSSISIMIYMKIDQIMLALMIGDSAVGQYSVSVKFSEVWFFIPITLTASLFPSVLKSRETDINLYNIKFRAQYNICFWIALFISLIFLPLSEHIIVFLYGADYYEAAAILKVHVWSSIFVFMGVVCGKWFVAENLQKEMFYFHIFGAFNNFLLNLYFIPLYASLGSAIATLISYSTSMWFVSLFIEKYRKPIFLRWITSINIFRLKYDFKLLLK